jgi:hypothetical protein
MKRNKSHKWSIQITKSLAEYLKQFCKERGFTMSGFIEGAVIQRISGSYGK